MSGVASRVRIEGEGRGGERGGGAPGEGRRASRRRLPHPAKRLLPLNRQNVYLTQPWRRRRRERASLPRHAVARRARFRFFRFSHPSRNPPRTASASGFRQGQPDYLSPPAFIIPGKTRFSFLLPCCVCLCVYINIYVYVYACVGVSVRVRHRQPLWFGPCSCPSTRRREDSQIREEGERKRYKTELGGGGGEE